MVLHPAGSEGGGASGFSTSVAARAWQRGCARGHPASEELMSEQDTGHPHRCREGHRWQHTGPTAVACEIPAHDAELGGLPLVSSRDCPVCSGREELLTRDLHSHYCNICEGDWDHEGRCLEGPVACCPWCFPAADAAPAPGARRGPHFIDRKSTRLNSSHDQISYAVFCLKKKKIEAPGLS